jgi:serine/threonine protein kinase
MKVAMATGTVAGPEKPGFTPPSTQELGLKFPQLEIIELIGRGGMGAVYKARQKELDRIVALKILPPGIGDDAAFAERFAREAKALARLNHPGIVTIHDFGRTDGLYFFVMEFVDGVNLCQLLASARVSPREALAIVPQICDALQFAHDQGIVHRDIKPENILLDRRGRVKVADFGLAKIVEGRDASPRRPSDGERTAGPAVPTSLTDAGKVMGTPAYMAPEQVTHPADVDHRADIYALGVVFYQMLTGELPGKPIAAPSSKVQIDVRLDEVVLRALEKNPELRYQQVSEVKTMVESISSSSAPGTGTAPSPARPAPTLGRLRAALIVGVLVWFVAGTVTLIMCPSWKVVAVISCPEKSQPGRPVEEHFKFIASMIELIRSDVILGRVIDRLQLDERSGKLDERWGKRNLGLKLTKAQAMVLLKRRLDVRSEGGTLIQVGVFGKRPEEPEEAMDIANTIAEELRAYRIEQHDPPADMLEMTLRGTLTTLRLADILLGLAAGFVPGSLAGGLVLLFAFLRRGPQASQVKKGVETIVGSAGELPAEPGVSPVPESAEGRAPPRPPSASESADLENARAQVKGPAIGLLVVGILNWLATPLVVLAFVFWNLKSAPGHAGGPDVEPSILLLLLLLAAIGLVPAVLSTLMIVAALKMKRLRAYGLAITASILAIISPVCPIGLPIAVWALVVLSRREVRDAFASKGKGTIADVPLTVSPTTNTAAQVR